MVFLTFGAALHRNRFNSFVPKFGGSRQITGARYSSRVVLNNLNCNIGFIPRKVFTTVEF